MVPSSVLTGMTRQVISRLEIKVRGIYASLLANTSLIKGDSSTQGRCQPQADGRYQWGFSFLLLFICLVLLLVWTVGTYLLWLKPRIAMRDQGEREIAGEYTAVVELATAMNNEFEKHEEKLGAMRERQIRTKIKEDLKGGAMIYHAPIRERNSGFWVSLKRASKRDKWWILAFSIGMLFTIVVGCLPPTGSGLAFVSFSSIVVLGIVFARFVGVQKRSRRLMIALFILMGAVVAIIIVSEHNNLL
jgi:hypothetical protein